MRSRLLLSALFVAAALTACENQEAASHRAAVAAIEAATASLREAPPTGEQAIPHLKSIAKTLRGLRGLSRTLKASQYRLLTQVDLQLAGYIHQSGLESRTAAIDMAATIAALQGSASLQKQRLGQRAATPEQLGGDELANSRIATIQQQENLQRQHQQRQPDLATAERANKEAAAEALTLRTRAAELLARAAAVDAITGKPLRTEAAELDHRAAGIEAAMERRGAEADMYVRLELANLSLETEGVSAQVDVIDSEIERVHALATHRREHDEAGEETLRTLNERLGEASVALIDSLTGPLRENYDTTIATLQQAAQSASKVQGDRSSKEGDLLAQIQVQVVLMNIARTRADMLARSIRLLGAVATLGQTPGAGKWIESRQVLQQDRKAADAIATRARAEAVTLTGSLGGEAAAMLLGQLDGSGPPAEEPPSAAPTPDEPTPDELPAGGADGASVDPELDTLATSLVSIIGMPKSEQVAALRPLMKCDAPSQPCAIMDLDADLNKAVADFAAAIEASPLANDPGAAMMATAVQSMAGADGSGMAQATLEGVQQSGPDTATITCTATIEDLGIPMTLETPAELTADGWKLTGLPAPAGTPPPTLAQMQNVLSSLNAITSKIQSGEIADTASLQQAVMTLAPQ